MAADNVSAGEAAETGPPSRTARKKASERLQDLGAELVEARASLVAGLKLPERLREAIVDAKGMRSFGAAAAAIHSSVSRDLFDRSLRARCRGVRRRARRGVTPTHATSITTSLNDTTPRHGAGRRAGAGRSHRARTPIVATPWGSARHADSTGFWRAALSLLRRVRSCLRRDRSRRPCL